MDEFEAANLGADEVRRRFPTTDDSREQAIKQGALTMAYSEGTVNAPKDGKFWRLAEALETAGLLAGTANTAEAHSYSTWGETKLRADVSRLNEEVMAHQVGDGYEKGYEHGSALAAQHKDRADRAVAELAALRDKVRALADDWMSVAAVIEPAPWMTYKQATAQLRSLLTDGDQS